MQNRPGSGIPAAGTGFPGNCRPEGPIIRRLKGPRKKYRFLGLLAWAPGGPEAPGRPPRALRGHSRGFRGPPGGLRDLRQARSKNPETNEIDLAMEYTWGGKTFHVPRPVPGKEPTEPLDSYGQAPRDSANGETRLTMNSGAAKIR